MSVCVCVAYSHILWDHGGAPVHVLTPLGGAAGYWLSLPLRQMLPYFRKIS